MKIIRNTDKITGEESNKKRGSKGWYDPKTGEVDYGAIRLNWSNEGVGRGLKAETGWGEGERRNMLGILASRKKGGMSIPEAGDRLMEYAREMGYSFVDQEDANAGRNAIIDLLRGARTWGNVSNYIADRRKEQEARHRSAEEEYQRQMYEEYIQNRYHMTPEEYEVFEEMWESLKKEEELSSSDQNELNAIFAEAYQKQEEYERRNEKETRQSNESSDPRETENIQGELTGSQESGSSEQSEISGPDGTPSEERQESPSTGIDHGANVVGDEHFRTLTAELIRLEELTGRTNAQLFPDENSLLMQAEKDGIPDKSLYKVQQTFKRAREIDEQYYGFTDSKTGKIYLYIPSIPNTNELNSFWAHEQVHSLASQGVVKINLTDLYNLVGENEMRRIMNPYCFEGNPSKEDLAEEYLAHLIEKLVRDGDNIDIVNGEHFIPRYITTNETVVETINSILNEIYFNGRTEDSNRSVERNEPGRSTGVIQDEGISRSSRTGEERNDPNVNENGRNNLLSSSGDGRQNTNVRNPEDRSGEGQIKAEELKEQEAQVDQNPSEAQKEAGNYKMGHIKQAPMT